jgi:hypothetical protein
LIIGASESGDVAVAIGASAFEAILFKMSQITQFKMTTKPFLINLTVIWECLGMSEKIISILQRIAHHQHFRERRDLDFNQMNHSHRMNSQMDFRQEVLQILVLQLRADFTEGKE